MITYWHGLDLLGQSDGTDEQYFQYDGLGSVRQLVNGTDTVLYVETFDPYGNLYASAGADDQTNYAFTGEQQDGNGLLFLRARYYSASMGRFGQADPSRQEQNPYLYSRSNPSNVTDPSGLCGADSYNSREMADDCERLVEALERKYGFTIFWPGRYVDLTKLGVTSEFAKNYDPCVDSTFAIGAEDATAIVERWRLSEINDISIALKILENNIGLTTTQNIARDGILYKVHHLPDARYNAGFCSSGDCSTGWSYPIFAGARYSLAVSSSGWLAGTDALYRYKVIIHEFGHGAASLLRESEAAAWDSLMWNQFYDENNEDSAPSLYARDNEREYFAETFAIYIWETDTTARTNFDPPVNDYVRLSRIKAKSPFYPGVNSSTTLYEYFHDVLVAIQSSSGK